MQAPDMQASIQPFIKLAQSNMALLTRFSTSPEVVSQAMANAQSLMQREPGAVSGLVPSNAFAQLVQGMLQNYAEFMAELGRSGMAMLAQGPTAMMQGAEEAAGTADTRGRRAR